MAFKQSLIAVLALTAACAANAIPSIGDLDIDFRTEAWGAFDGSASGQIGNTTVTALLKPFGNAKLSHSDSGLGIDSSILFDEEDEIDNGVFGFQEILHVEFENAVELASVWVTRLFDNRQETELGAYSLNGGLATTFGPGTLSGDLSVSLGGVSVTSIKFFATGDLKNEFSVAGFEAVPEPGTLSALALGLLFFGVRGRARRAA